jgi:hypothetical protein
VSVRLPPPVPGFLNYGAVSCESRHSREGPGA